MKEKDIPVQILKEFSTVLNFSIGKHTGLVTPKNREILTNAREKCLGINGQAVPLLRTCLKNIIAGLNKISENGTDDPIENIKTKINHIITEEINKLATATYAVKA